LLGLYFACDIETPEKTFALKDHQIEAADPGAFQRIGEEVT